MGPPLRCKRRAQHLLDRGLADRPGDGRSPWPSSGRARPHPGRATPPSRRTRPAGARGRPPSGTRETSAAAAPLASASATNSCPSRAAAEGDEQVALGGPSGCRSRCPLTAQSPATFPPVAAAAVGGCPKRVHAILSHGALMRHSPVARSMRHSPVARSSATLQRRRPRRWPVRHRRTGRPRRPPSAPFRAPCPRSAAHRPVPVRRRRAGSPRRGLRPWSRRGNLAEFSIRIRAGSSDLGLSSVTNRTSAVFGGGFPHQGPLAPVPVAARAEDDESDGPEQWASRALSAVS